MRRVYLLSIRKKGKISFLVYHLCPAVLITVDSMSTLSAHVMWQRINIAVTTWIAPETLQSKSTWYSRVDNWRTVKGKNTHTQLSVNFQMICYLAFVELFNIIICLCLCRLFSQNCDFYFKHDAKLTCKTLYSTAGSYLLVMDDQDVKHAELWLCC